MPLFDWDANSISNVPTQHSWVYWAVTGPLTLTTVIIVIFWALWHRRQSRLKIWLARNMPEKDDSSGNPNAEGDTNPRQWLLKFPLVGTMRRRHMKNLKKGILP
jgi:hypothetical protein